jgi:type I restriction enzyme S subunit
MSIKLQLKNICYKFIKLKDLVLIKGRIGFRGYTQNDIVNENEGAITLSPGNIENGEIVFNNLKYVSWFKYEESPEIKVNINDLVFCKTGSTVGKIALVKDLPKETTINPQLVLLKNCKCNVKYLKFYMESKKFQNEIKKITSGAIPNLSQRDLGEILIPVPDENVQEEIVRIVENMFNFTNDLEKELYDEIILRRKQYEYYRNEIFYITEDEKDY